MATTQSQALALVHGDVSPKNILVGAQGPVLLDAECAWWGDPAFDLAFCLNHLLLKCLWNAAATPAFLAAFETLCEVYLQGVNWEPRGRLEQRAAALLPGLLLARVDGKSPVEYIDDEAQREVVRRVARGFLLAAGRARGPDRHGLARGSSHDERSPHPQHPRPPRLGQPRPADGRSRADLARRRQSGRAIVPAGASKGTREALELRDCDAALRRPRRDARRRQRQRQRSRQPWSARPATTRPRSTRD